MLTLLITFLNIDCKSQNINITYDDSQSQHILTYWKKGSISQEEMDKFMGLYGTKMYLKKLATFFDDVDPVSFEQSIRQAIEGKPSANDRYMFNQLLSKKETAQKMLNLIQEHEAEITQKSIQLISRYVPASLTMDMKVYLVFGIIGGGWTFADEPNAFFLDISNLGVDYEGMTYLAAHELFHVVQDRMMPPSTAKHNGVQYLIDEMVKEGMATFIADFGHTTNNGEYSQFSVSIQNRNLRRIQSNFTLLETLIFRAHFDQEVQIDQLYSIGLSGMYGSPLYYVAYYMISKLDEEQKSGDYVMSMFNQPYEKLVLDYNALALEKGYPSLSKQIIEIIQQ